MSQSAPLFDLVKTLSSAEKRYFKVFASRYKGEKNYLKLFDAIAKQEEYDEESLKKKFRKAEFTKHLNYTKNYLYNLILKSLQSYHDKSQNFDLLNLQQQIEILYKRGLYKQSLKLITKAKKVAESSGKFLTLVELLDWEKEISFTNLLRPTNADLILEIYKEQQEFLRKFTIGASCRQLHTEFYQIYNKVGIPRNEKQLQAYEKIKDELLQYIEPSSSSPPNALAIAYDTLASYYGLKGNQSKRYEFQKKVLEIFEDNKKRIELNAKGYISALSNFLGSCLQLGYDDEFFTTLNKMRDLPEKLPDLDDSESIQTLAFHLSYNRELDYYTYRNEFNAGLKIIPKIEEGLRIYEKTMSNQAKLYIALKATIIHFAVDNFEDSLIWCERTIGYYDENYSPLIFFNLKMISLIIHYELGNFDLLEHKIISTYKYLLTRQKNYKFETAVLTLFRKLPRVTEGEELVELFKNLKKDLTQLLNDPYEGPALSYFMYIEWFESKITGVPLIDILMRKHSEAA